MAKRLIPTFNRILIEKIIAPCKTNSGILLPEKTAKLNSGKVVAVGPGTRGKDENFIPVAVKEGDTVLLPEYGGTEVKLGDKDIEEAKKRMYACSTTTYDGFQAVMTEEEAEKFCGIGGQTALKFTRQHGSIVYRRTLRKRSRLNCDFFAGCPSMVLMRWVRRALLVSGRRLHSLSRNGPSETLKRRVEEMKKMIKKNNPKKDELFVEVPESRAWLDTASLPLFLTVVGTALFAKLLMMHDDSKSQEMIERKIKNAPPGQGTVRMLTREEWEEFRKVRPRTPFESKLARPNARIRTGESVRAGDLKDWTIDVLTNALTRIEESAKRN